MYIVEEEKLWNASEHGRARVSVRVGVHGRCVFTAMCCSQGLWALRSVSPVTVGSARGRPGWGRTGNVTVDSYLRGRCMHRLRAKARVSIKVYPLMYVCSQDSVVGNWYPVLTHA